MSIVDLKFNYKTSNSRKNKEMEEKEEKERKKNYMMRTNGNMK